MAEITDELKAKAEKAKNNLTDCYPVIATGNTYPVREDMQNWAFFWDVEKRAWINENASALEKFLFERKVIGGKWLGVELEFVKHEKMSI